VRSKILIVDDEETLTWGMSKSLSKSSDRFEILTANSGEEALGILEAHAVDLIISDIRMPGMSGLDLLTRVRSDHPEIGVIVMTAYGSPDVQRAATDRGSMAYIEKPFEMQDIEDLINRVLNDRDRTPAEKAAEPHVGFEGRVSNLHLTDVIQINCLGRMTCALKINRGDDVGMIYFREGEIVHATTGSMMGREAFYNILGWQGGSFETIDRVLPTEETISDGWQHLLLEGMHRLDEAELPPGVRVLNGIKTASKLEPVGTTAPAPSIKSPPTTRPATAPPVRVPLPKPAEEKKAPPVEPEPTPVESTIEEKPSVPAPKVAEAPPEPVTVEQVDVAKIPGVNPYEKVVNRVHDLTGVEGAIVVAQDGVVLASDLEQAEVLGTGTLYLGSAVAQLTSLLGTSPFRYAVIGESGGRLLVGTSANVVVGVRLDDEGDPSAVWSEAARILTA
jgi:CheY-like chemotaxis protein/predicted regulator of Ras-like GTPase activity (Roadblock/LC7/MglB family)